MRAQTLVSAGLLLLNAACSRMGTGATLTPTSTITPSATATVRPTETATEIPPSATPEPTPDLTWILDAPLSSNTRFEIPPNLQYLSPDTVWIPFQALEPADLTLHLWPESDPAEHREFPYREDQRGVIAHGLSPGTAYLAQVLASQEGEDREPSFLGTEWGPLRFETPQKHSAVIRFGVIGDSGFGDPTTAALVDQLSTWDLDFIIHTGDVVYRGEENAGPADAFQNKFFEMFAPLIRHVPVYPVIGNHEYDLPMRLDDRPYYYVAFPSFPPGLNVLGDDDGERDWYALSIDGWRFVFLNTQMFFGLPGSEEQLAWLESILSGQPESRSILTMHVPPYSQGEHQSDSALVAAELSGYLEASPVIMTLAGHDHNYQRFLLDGIHHFVSGGGSATLYDIQGTDPSLRHGLSVSHILIVELRGTGVEVLALDSGGEVLDRDSFQVPR